MPAASWASVRWRCRPASRPAPRPGPCTWPACRFWNLCLWNPYLQTYDHRHEQVTINGGEAVAEPDGSHRLVVAHRDPGTPNWLRTAGHRSGILWFRWFLPEHTPAGITTEVVRLPSP